MDVAKAFTFVTEDEGWVRKLGIGAVVMLLSFLLVPIPLLTGYLVAVTRNVMNGVQRPLPEWDDLGGLFRDGLAVLIPQLVYTLPFWLLACIAFFATIGLSGLSDVSEDMAAAGFLATFGLIGCLGVIVFIALMFISPAIVIQYVRTNEMAATFRFGELIGIVRNNIGDILIALLATFGASLVLSLVAGVLGVVPCLGQIAALILSIVAGPYFLALSGHLYGQIAAKSAGKAAVYPG
jgi:hypothetical protein